MVYIIRTIQMRTTTATTHNNTQQQQQHTQNIEDRHKYTHKREE